MSPVPIPKTRVSPSYQTRGKAPVQINGQTKVPIAPQAQNKPISRYRESPLARALSTLSGIDITDNEPYLRFKADLERRVSGLQDKVSERAELKYKVTLAQIQD